VLGPEGQRIRWYPGSRAKIKAGSNEHSPSRTAAADY
jgi:hypothetical protein